MQLHIIIIIVFTLVKGSDSFNPKFVMNILGSDKNLYEFSNVNISSVCKSKDKMCLWKCCPSKSVFNARKGTCTASKRKIANFSSITVYDAEFKITKKSFETVFQLVPEIMSNNIFKNNSFPYSKLSKPYLLEDGILYFDLPNTFKRWLIIKTNHFCVEMTPKNTTIFMAEVEPDMRSFYIIFDEVYALAITILFLLLTILPYSLFPQLRDIDGAILIVYLAYLVNSMLAKGFTICFVHNEPFSVGYILVIAILNYYYLVSSLCWTNVMFYRIRVASSNKTNGVISNDSTKFVTYCAYSFTLSIFLTVLVVVTETTDMSLIPWFITPQIVNNNIYFDGMESLFYLYIPSVLLLTYNWIICVTNVVDFFRQPRYLKSSTKIVKSPLKKKAQYVKLLVLLSVWCVVNVLSIIYPESNVRGNTTFYFTLCIGPVIFITFVVEQDVLIMAKEYFGKLKTDGKLLKSVWFKKTEVVAVVEIS